MGPDGQTGPLPERQFETPWEARAFALVVCLSEAGHFSWAEWVECLARHVADASTVQSCDGRASSYSEQWITAAEELLVLKGITSPEQLRARRLGAWPIASEHRGVEASGKPPPNRA